MALYWLRRPEFSAIEFTGDIQALRDWAFSRDTTPSETIIKRVEPYGEDGFLFFIAWNWTPDQEFQGQSGELGDFVVDEWGQLNVRTPEAFHDSYEPVMSTQPEGE